MKRLFKRLLYKLLLWWLGPLKYHATRTREEWCGLVPAAYEVRTKRGRLVGYYEIDEAGFGAYDPAFLYRGPDLYKDQ